MLRVVFIAAWSWMVVGAVYGQAFFPIESGNAPGRFIEPPRSMLQQLRLAEEAATQKRYGDAVVILGDLLQRERTFGDDELSGQDFFLDAPSDGRANTRVRKTLIGEARRIISSLPSEAIATYELRYGAQARKMLDDAVASKRWGDVAEVRRRFFHTEAGRDATQLLIQAAILRGDVIHARRSAELLLQHPKLDAAARNSLTALVEELVADTNTAEAATATETSTAPEASTATSERPLYASRRTRRDEPAMDFRFFAGQPISPESGGGQLPLASPRYTVDTTGSSRQERTLRESVDSMISMGELPPPSWLPIRVGNHLVMRTTERLVGVDFVTGKRVWEYPWFKTNDTIESSEIELNAMPDEDAGQSLLNQRVWNDLPYGRISSDGVRVYVLGDLAQVEVATLSPLMGLQGTRPAETGANSLVALDLSTEGKLVWQIGGDQPETENLSGAFFLGAPLPIDDALYVLAEMSGDILLLCLDAATGAERWRQQLLAVESGSIDIDPVRRVAGASATYQNGMLICSTGAGAIVAVDVDDRALVWGVSVERNDAINQSGMGRREGSIPGQLMKRWWDSTPMVSGTTVFVTPIETDRLFAFDLLTGEKRWKEFARAQMGSRYMAGIHDGTIVLVGGDNVRGVDAKTGKTTWKTRGGWLDSGEQLSGLGMFGMMTNPATSEPEPAYFVPTTSSRIIAVSLNDGSALAHRETSFPTGNLIAVDGQIISQAATLLSVAYGQVSLEPKVAAALELNPENVEMMIRKAQLLMEQQRRGEALKWLDKARQRESDNFEVQKLSINAMLGALREDFASNANLLGELDKLIDQPADRAELIKLQIRAAIDRNQPVEAVNRLIDLSALVALEPSLASQSSASESESSRYVSLDSWISARGTDAMEVAEPAQQELIATAVEEHMEKFSAASLGLVQRLVHQFGTLPGSEKAIRQLLGRYAADEKWLEMERIVLAGASTTPLRLESLAPWQSLALASAYVGGDLKEDAAAALQVAMRDPEAAKLAATELNIDLEKLAAKSVPQNLIAPWEGEVKVQLPNDPIIGRISSGRKISVGENKRVVGRSFAGWQLVSEDSSPVALRDPLGIVHPIPVDGINRREETQRQVVFNGGLMIAILPGELVAVNLFELMDGQADPVLWRRSWRTESGGTGFRRRSDSTAFGDQIYRYVVSGNGSGSVASELQLGPIVGDTFYLLQGNELLAIDAITKAVRWQNMEAPRDGAIVCDGETVAVVSPSSQLVIKYDCRDGKRLGEEPFTDFRLWASTDTSVLMYRDLPEGKRELVLRNPISGETLLEHTFEGLSENVRVLGRIVDGRYAVTLSSLGKNLVWDLENAKVVCDMEVEPIPELSGFHVLSRLDSLVMLPATIDAPSDTGSVAMTTTNGEVHVRVDAAAWAVGLQTGKELWKCSLEKQSWGCTLTQSPASPLVLFSRSKSRYLTTGSRMKSLDVLAIDVRDGKTYPSLDMPVESFNNEIETRLTVQLPQSRVIVNIGPVVLDYSFGGTPQKPFVPRMLD